MIFIILRGLYLEMPQAFVCLIRERQFEFKK